jgi:hypothetical protein
MSRRGSDSYYTPTWLADEVAAALPDSLSGNVLDPAAGEGALLAAVRRRFGSSVHPLAIDVDPDAVRNLSFDNPEWTSSRADFLVSSSRNSTLAWRTARRSLSAVVLNPPFSYRGNGGRSITFGGYIGRVTPAMHFLLLAMSGLNPEFGFVAILPNGALDAERNAALWSEIEQRFSVERLRSPSSSSFAGARVATTIVRLRKRDDSMHPAPRRPPLTHIVRAEDSCTCVEVVRGRVPVHKLAGHDPAVAQARYFHTTSFRASAATVGLTAPDSLSDQGPLLLVARVGRWQRPCAVELGRVVLSDCIIGLRPRERGRFSQLRSWVESHEHAIAASYRGTGAPYITLSTLTDILESGGWHTHVVRASSQPTNCCCAASASSCLRAG